MALSRKRPYLYGLRPDIAVIPECARSCIAGCAADGFRGRWFGENLRKGLGVLVAEPLHIERTGKLHGRWVVPLWISSSAAKFLLVAVWTMPVAGSHGRSYIGQLYQALTANRRWFNGTPSIVCGDFNSNKFWDNRRSVGNHSAVVSLLEKRGLASAYHQFYSELQGEETRPTYYFWHRADRGYHIDYAFVSKAWTPRISSVSVGDCPTWIKHSDHVPLIVDVDL